jgi:hypothetical protein
MVRDLRMKAVLIEWLATLFPRSPSRRHKEVGNELARCLPYGINHGIHKAAPTEKYTSTGALHYGQFGPQCPGR